jgi:hypothetical protein
MKAAWRCWVQRLRSHSLSGQGLVETALLLPILFLVLSGLVEFGFLMNDFMVVQDASRNAARFAVDNAYNARDGVHDCATTKDFYRQIGCVVNQELEREKPDVRIDFSTGIDDVVVSAFSVEGGNPPKVSARFPEGEGEAGWSYSLDETGTRNQSSRFSSAQIAAKLSATAPSTGYVLVEVFYSYDQKLKLPWIEAFLADPVVFHVYTIMPLSSAEPTPTNIP